MPGDTENGPIVLTQVFEEVPDSLFTPFRRPTNLETIPEASPRPSEDSKQAVPTPEKPPTHPLLSPPVKVTVPQGSETTTATVLPTSPFTPIQTLMPFVQQVTPSAPPALEVGLPPRKDVTPLLVQSTHAVAQGV